MAMIKLKDVEILDITDDSWISVEGCPTCDFGRMFCSDIDFTLSNGKILAIQTEHPGAFTMSDFLKFMLQEDIDFSTWTLKKFRTELIKYMNKIVKEYDEPNSKVRYQIKEVK